MNRDIEVELKRWKISSRRKPLIIQGARQVGKTYTIKSFGNTAYEDIAYFNFEENPDLDSIFIQDLNPARILAMLSLAEGITIDPENTLVFFDEIQESNRALSSLKYFAEQAPQYHVVAAGSLLGVKLSEPGSFPVGQVTFLYMYPLSFYEFLSALNQEELRQFIEHKSDLAPIPEIFHTRLVDFLKVYYITGGMPACVQTYLDTNNGDACRKVQQDILTSYVLDFSKHVPSADIPKVISIWNSLPAQLARENKKFLYRLVREGARARTYENALAWLEDSGLTLRARQVSAVRIPLSSYASYKAFKIYVHDVGLLGALSMLHPGVLLQGNRLFTEFRGAFTENYVAQELSAGTGNKLYYWSSEGEAEVDFLIESQGQIVPLEVKAGLGIKSKSLRVFAEKTGSSRLFRTGLRNFSSSQIIRHFPLYAVANSPRFLN